MWRNPPLARAAGRPSARWRGALGAAGQPRRSGRLEGGWAGEAVSVGEAGCGRGVASVRASAPAGPSVRTPRTEPVARRCELMWLGAERCEWMRSGGWPCWGLPRRRFRCAVARLSARSRAVCLYGLVSSPNTRGGGARATDVFSLHGCSRRRSGLRDSACSLRRPSLRPAAS